MEEQYSPEISDIYELKAESLSVAFEGKKILSNVSFDVKKGDCIALTGPSGSGKSTILRCLNRLNSNYSGKIKLRGKDISLCDPATVRRYITLTGQIPAMFPGTVLFNLQYPFSFKANANIKKPDFNSLLKSVGLPSEFLFMDAEKLSVGEQQRVAIARALALSPKILLLDEPTASLDEISKYVLEDLIIKLNTQTGITIIFVTHDNSQAERVAKRIFRIEDRRLREIL
ncbi:ATP-binding cassette domain-containing protein [Methanoplanus sp. FWC-SCC4]|uniref:ATP-binding cassette domain-containing protein n=1 Tax=Methanochimaera problematica TaxID=2609417 RepID=A0AA97I3C4_9EURY|nr:ATP-binding cassette domain-containing protein [Methanoplanus sp. FWC-SCC4]WOF17205.1 ATP-binding cassette domain-containing protein [Methanoplanus sp. FWC-SCC4]